MGMKLGLSRQGKNIDWGCLRTGCSKKLHNEGFSKLYSSLNAARVINQEGWDELDM